MKNRQEKLKQWDKEYLWHPFTQMKEYLEEEPLIIASGEGCYLTDIEGKKYLDGISSLWVNVHGHCHPALSQAIKEQADKIAHSTLLGSANVPSIELAQQLLEIAPPGLSKVFYSDSGSTSVEVAIKMAFQYWQQKEGDYKEKKTFISLSQAYHGDTVGSVSVGGIDLFHRLYSSLLFETEKIPSPYCYRCPLGKEKESCSLACLQKLEDILATKNEKIAALIIEPLMQGAAGMISAPNGYLSKVRELCHQYNVLLIADEVATGFGRTGTMFACQQENVTPDLMCIAKGITGGYLPLAATLTTQEIYNAFLGDYQEKKTFFHGHSYTGNQLACAVALANLKLFKEEKLIKKIVEKVTFLHKGLEKFKYLQHVGDIRQVGMMIGIELVKEKKSKEAYLWQEKMGNKVCQLAREKGVLLRPLEDTIVLMPILAMSLEELNKLLEITYQAISLVTEGE